MTNCNNMLLTIVKYPVPDLVFSCPLDDNHFISAARYVDRNPVRAKICKTAGEYQWSSPQYHLGGRKKDPLIKSKYKGLVPQ